MDAWLSESPAPGGGEDGFHVICARSATTLHVYQHGVMTSSPLEVKAAPDGDIRGPVAAALQIGKFIRYSVQGKPPLEWEKPPWVIFTTKGKRLKPGEEGAVLEKRFEQKQDPSTLLLFEGGTWRWPTMHAGYVRQVLPGITLTTVSRQPALFEVKFELERATAGGQEEELSIGLLSDVVGVAEPSLMQNEGYGQTRTSAQTFLRYDDHPKLQKLRDGTAKLLRVPKRNLEHLQVVRYGLNQHYDAHRDYWDPREFPDVPRFTGPDGFWNQRHATLLWYLAAPGEGGQTWFPRAHGGPIPYDNWLACDNRGASVSPANATAVLFYSLKADGDLDEYSWHCGCPVKKGVKWAANSWVHNGPYLSVNEEL